MQSTEVHCTGVHHKVQYYTGVALEFTVQVYILKYSTLQVYILMYSAGVYCAQNRF